MNKGRYNTETTKDEKHAEKEEKLENRKDRNIAKKRLKT